MLENDILEQWLSAEAKRVLAKLSNDEPLTQDNKLIIVLKGQMNHFHHLDVELRQEVVTLRQDMERRFEQVDRRFETITDEIRQLYRAMNAQTWKMISAVGLIVLLAKLIEQL